MTDQEFAAAIPRKVEDPSSDHMGMDVTSVRVTGLDGKTETVSPVYGYNVDTGTVLKPIYGDVVVTFTNPDTKTEFRVDRYGVVKVIAPNVYEHIAIGTRQTRHREIVETANSLSTLASRMAESAEALNEVLRRMAKNGGAK